MFKSRQKPASALAQEFFASLMPGVIPRNQFIQWSTIKGKCQEFADVVEYYEALTANQKKNLRAEIRDSLLAADDPSHLIKGSFELLGHTNDYYVSDEDNLQFEDATEKIKKDNEKAASQVAAILIEVGLENVIHQADLESTFLGVQVGLESNRRKSVGGQIFNEWVRRLLDSSCALLGKNYEVRPEAQLAYSDSRNGKKVDFALLYKGTIKIGVEVNFYTTGGSKPTEVKRSYQNVNQELNRKGIELVWITDGVGHLKMKKNLEEIFRVHPNTYNYRTAERYFKDDVYEFLK